MLNNGDGFTVVYLYVLFLGDDVKYHAGYIISICRNGKKCGGKGRGNIKNFDNK
jgi:hypothetical protein